MTATALTRASEEIAPERLTEAGRAVADLAHLAKNIIQVMGGCAEIIDLAIKKGQWAQVEKAWQLYQPSFWRLKKLQLDLIKYAKEYPLTLQPCLINDVAAAAVKPLEAMLAKRRITLSMRPADGVPSLNADGEKLRDAVMNLLINAADNLQDEAGTIIIETFWNNNEKTVTVSVSDSGESLDEAARIALLTPYERCRNMLGTGLEIPLAKQVAENHKGNLRFGENLSTGNCVQIVLPCGELKFG